MRLVLLFAMFALLCCCSVFAQEQPTGKKGEAADSPPDKVFVKVKLFNANAPAATIPLIPSQAIVFFRDQATKAPKLLRGAKFSAVEDGFYQLEVPKDILIEQIVISVSSKSGTNFNPGVISKVVTRNAMTIYPGASNPVEIFNFHAYMSQMATYQTILQQLLDEIPASKQEILTYMRGQYGDQLNKMASVADQEQIVDANGQKASAAQLKSAKELASKVLVAYALRQPPKPAKKVAPCPPQYYHQPYCPPRQGWR